jgi:hypothetical protein
MQEDINKISINARLRTSEEEIKKSISGNPRHAAMQYAN